MQSPTTSSIDPTSATLRVLWMTLLPAILVTIGLVAAVEPWTFTGRDVALVLLVVVAIGARAADTFYFGGTTADGDPSTRAHVSSYALRLVMLSIGGWILAQSIGI